MCVYLQYAKYAAMFSNMQSWIRKHTISVYLGTLNLKHKNMHCIIHEYVLPYWKIIIIISSLFNIDIS